MLPAAADAAGETAHVAVRAWERDGALLLADLVVRIEFNYAAGLHAESEERAFSRPQPWRGPGREATQLAEEINFPDDRYDGSVRRIA
jgi:hypothetical protein